MGALGWPRPLVEGRNQRPLRPPSEYAYKYVRKLGIDVYLGELYDAEFLKRFTEYFDVVTAVEVLEHHHLPKRLIHAIYATLRRGGIFFYTTGNADRMRLEGAKWSYLNPEGHIYYFTPKIMKRYLSEAKLAILNPYNYYHFYRKTLNRLLKEICMLEVEKRLRPKSFREKFLYTFLLKI